MTCVWHCVDVARKGIRQTVKGVTMATPRQCHTPSTPAFWPNLMAVYNIYTLQTRLMSTGWRIRQLEAYDHNKLQNSHKLQPFSARVYLLLPVQAVHMTLTGHIKTNIWWELHMSYPVINRSLVWTSAIFVCPPFTGQSCKNITKQSDYKLRTREMLQQAKPTGQWTIGKGFMS